jgi:hypothetical protein
MNKTKLTEAAKAFARKDVREDDLKAFDNSWTFEMLTKGFEAGAQWYERSLEGVVVEGARKWEISHVGAFMVEHRVYGPQMTGRIKVIEALPVQALIASQKSEIERLRKALLEAGGELYTISRATRFGDRIQSANADAAETAYLKVQEALKET